MTVEKPDFKGVRYEFLMRGERCHKTAQHETIGLIETVEGIRAQRFFAGAPVKQTLKVATYRGLPMANCLKKLHADGQWGVLVTNQKTLFIGPVLGLKGGANGRELEFFLGMAQGILDAGNILLDNPLSGISQIMQTYRSQINLYFEKEGFDGFINYVGLEVEFRLRQQYFNEVKDKINGAIDQFKNYEDGKEYLLKSAEKSLTETIPTLERMMNEADDIHIMRLLIHIYCLTTTYLFEIFVIGSYKYDRDNVPIFGRYLEKIEKSICKYFFHEVEHYKQNEGYITLGKVIRFAEAFRLVKEEKRERYLWQTFLFAVGNNLENLGYEEYRNMDSLGRENFSNILNPFCEFYYSWCKVYNTLWRFHFKEGADQSCHKIYWPKGLDLLGD